jgi:Leucine-rich repeat (LRR) protein
VGSINPSLSNLNQLKLLYLQHNDLSGLLPTELCSLQQLKRLNLSHNNFRGVLPNDIGNLCNLESFLLSNNAIIGPVPLSISNLQNLKDFHIFKNFPSQSLTLPKACDKKAFDRIYAYGPSTGINNVHWNFLDLYGRERTDDDNDSVTVFSGAL